VLGAVAQRGTCQAGGSSSGFCWGWQLLAELANEQKNCLFSHAGQPIYVFRSPGCLGSLGEYCVAVLSPRLLNQIAKHRVLPSPYQANPFETPGEVPQYEGEFRRETAWLVWPKLCTGVRPSQPRLQAVAGPLPDMFRSAHLSLLYSI